MEYLYIIIECIGEDEVVHVDGYKSQNDVYNAIIDSLADQIDSGEISLNDIESEDHNIYKEIYRVDELEMEFKVAKVYIPK